MDFLDIIEDVMEGILSSKLKTTTKVIAGSLVLAFVTGGVYYYTGTDGSNTTKPVGEGQLSVSDSRGRGNNTLTNADTGCISTTKSTYGGDSLLKVDMSRGEPFDIISP